MKVTVRKPVEVDVKYLEIVVPVRYGEEQMPLGFPMRENDTWQVTIDVDTGIVENWPRHSKWSLAPVEVHLKVVDEGCYYLYDADRQQVAAIEEDYVPHGFVPDMCGDYIVLTIEPDGHIKEWRKEPDVSAFFNKGE